MDVNTRELVTARIAGEVAAGMVVKGDVSETAIPGRAAEMAMYTVLEVEDHIDNMRGPEVGVETVRRLQPHSFQAEIILALCRGADVVAAKDSAWEIAEFIVEIANRIVAENEVRA